MLSPSLVQVLKQLWVGVSGTHHQPPPWLVANNSQGTHQTPLPTQTAYTTASLTTAN